MNNKLAVIIAGPTGSGKTSLAIEIARHYQTEIISADSRQCYREMNIGVAKPSADQLRSVKHHFINSHSVTQNLNACAFEDYAIQAANRIFETTDILVMAGGTGLYIKAFLEGMDAIPAIPQDLRARLNAEYAQSGLEWLQRQIQEKDPGYYAFGEIKNPRRLLRALEVITHTGCSIRDYQVRKTSQRSFNVCKLAINIGKERLHNQINDRVEQMMKDGLKEEVRSLLPYRDLNALQTVGYAEIFDYLDGFATLEDATDRIKINTRHYAKRQMTWFKKDHEYQWLNEPDSREAIRLIEASASRI